MQEFLTKILAGVQKVAAKQKDTELRPRELSSHGTRKEVGLWDDVIAETLQRSNLCKCHRLIFRHWWFSDKLWKIGSETNGFSWDIIDYQSLYKTVLTVWFIHKNDFKFCFAFLRSGGWQVNKTSLPCLFLTHDFIVTQTQ